MPNVVFTNLSTTTANNLQSPNSRGGYEESQLQFKLTISSWNLGVSGAR